MGKVTLTFLAAFGEDSIEVDSKITKLDLSFMTIRSIDLSPLSSCTALKELDLSWNLLQSIDLSPLSSCTALKELDLSWNLLQSIDLIPLSSCTNLRTLILGGNELQSIDLSPLSSCTNLQELNLLRSQLQSIDLSPLKDCTNLQVLFLQDNQLRSIDLSPLSSCTNLQRLAISKSQLRSIDLSPLSSCTALKELGLVYNELQSIDLSPLSSCTNLQGLSLDGNQLQAIDLSPLKDCTALKELDLHENPTAEIRLDPVLSLRNLEDFAPPSLCTSYISKKAWEEHERKGTIPKGIWKVYQRGRILILTEKELKELEEKKPEYHCKVIFMGDTRAGKTTLLKRMKSEEVPQSHISTIGVDVDEFKVVKDDRVYIGHGWDFGGQLEHALSHQLFFSPGALYLYVICPKYVTEFQEDMDRWIGLFTKTCGTVDSNAERAGYLVAVRTHTDLHELDGKWDESLPVLKERLKGLGPRCHAEVFMVSSVTDGDEGLDELRGKLPVLMHEAGAKSLKRIEKSIRLWEGIIEYQNQFMTRNPNSAGIMSDIELVREAELISGFENVDLHKWMRENEFGTILSYMNKFGVLASFYDEDEERYYVMLNPDTAGKILSQIIEAARKHGTGIVPSTQVTQWREEGIEFEVNEEESGKGHYRISAGEMCKLLDFIIGKDIAVKDSDGSLLLPYAFMNSSCATEDEWNRYSKRLAVNLQWLETGKYIDILKRFAINSRLRFYSVWQTGFLLRNKDSDDLMYRLHHSQGRKLSTIRMSIGGNGPQQLGMAYKDLKHRLEPLMMTLEELGEGGIQQGLVWMKLVRACPTCQGNVLVLADGNWLCSKCEGEIDQRVVLESSGLVESESITAELLKRIEMRVERVEMKLSEHDRKLDKHDGKLDKHHRTVVSGFAEMARKLDSIIDSQALLKSVVEKNQEVLETLDRKADFNEKNYKQFKTFIMDAFRELGEKLETHARELQRYGINLEALKDVSEKQIEEVIELRLANREEFKRIYAQLEKKEKVSWKHFLPDLAFFLVGLLFEGFGGIPVLISLIKKAGQFLKRKLTHLRPWK